MNILIADNDFEVVEVLAEVLCSHGYCVDKVHDGKRALECLQAKHYDIAILDHDMPELTGLEVVKYIKKHFPVTKTVIITGYPAMTELFAKTVGADEFIEKPFTIDQILKTVQRYGRGEKAS